MCPTVLYSRGGALPLVSDMMVQSRISPGLTAVALSKGTSAESRSTAAESSIFTSGLAAFASIRCRWAKPAAPATIKVNAAISSTINLFFDFIIWFSSPDVSGWFGGSELAQVQTERYAETLFPIPCSELIFPGLVLNHLRGRDNQASFP